MSQYTMFSKYGNCMRLLKIKNKLKVGCFLQIKSERILDVSWAFLIKQLALALVVWIWDDYSQLRLVGYLPPHIQRALVE